MPIKLFGYAMTGKKLHKLSEVTVCLGAKDARELGDFLHRCAERIAADPAWEHEHFPPESGFVVFNVGHYGELKPRNGKRTTAKRPTGR